MNRDQPWQMPFTIVSRAAGGNEPVQRGAHFRTAAVGLVHLPNALFAV